MPSQHKHPPVSFRPKEDDRRWLFDYARAQGIPVNAVLTAALTEYRAIIAVAQGRLWGS